MSENSAQDEAALVTGDESIVELPPTMGMLKTENARLKEELRRAQKRIAELTGSVEPPKSPKSPTSPKSPKSPAKTPGTTPRRVYKTRRTKEEVEADKLKKEEDKKRREAEKLQTKEEKERRRKEREEERKKKEEEREAARVAKEAERKRLEKAVKLKTQKKLQRVANMWASTGVQIGSQTPDSVQAARASAPRRPEAPGSAQSTPAPSQPEPRARPAKVFGVTYSRVEYGSHRTTETTMPKPRGALMAAAEFFAAARAGVPEDPPVFPPADVEDINVIDAPDAHPALVRRRRTLYYSEDYRPPYVGTFSRVPDSCGPTRPLTREADLGYSTDSGAELEWIDGEGVDSDSDDDDDVLDDEERVELERLIVPDGYLSASEAADSDDDAPGQAATEASSERMARLRKAEKTREAEAALEPDQMQYQMVARDAPGLGAAYMPIIVQTLPMQTVDGLPKRVPRPRKRKAPEATQGDATAPTGDAAPGDVTPGDAAPAPVPGKALPSLLKPVTVAQEDAK